MTGDSLQTILQVERQVQDALAEERQRNVGWLAEQRAAIEREQQAERAALSKACESREQIARQTAEQEAAAALATARQATAQFDTIDDAILERVVVRHLRRLLPEGEP